MSSGGIVQSTTGRRICNKLYYGTLTPQRCPGWSHGELTRRAVLLPVELGKATQEGDIQVLKDKGPLMGWKGFRQRKQYLPK